MANFEGMVNFPQLWWERILSALVLFLSVVYYGSLYPIIPIFIAIPFGQSEPYMIALWLIVLWICIPLICKLAIYGLERFYRRLVPN